MGERALALAGDEVVEGVTNFLVKDGKLFLNQLHLQGSSGGQIGRKALWDMARDLGRQYKVKEVLIQGGEKDYRKIQRTDSFTNNY